MKRSWDEIKSYLSELISLPPEGQRQWLDAKAEGDPELARQLEELLAADADSGWDPASLTDRIDHGNAGLGGDRLGPYRLLYELGRGGQGQVHLAEDTRLGRKVAVKVLTGWGASSKELLQRFRREAEVASRLDHPGICTVYDTGDVDGTPYIAMRYVEGKSLAQWLRDAKASSAPTLSVTVIDLEKELPEEDEAPEAESEPPSASTAQTKAEIDSVVRLVEQAARALHAAHEAGVVHRDIKPGNIMVTARGEPVILDFGLARAMEDDLPTLTRSGDVFGTPAYMAPEQLKGDQAAIDARTDVWALGVTLYECLALERPFTAATRDALYRSILEDTPRPLMVMGRRCPADLETVVRTALEKDRHRRYGSALELAEDLRRFRVFEPIKARPITRWIRFRRWAQRNPGIAAALAIIFLLLSTGLVITSMLLRENTAQRLKAEDQRDKKQIALNDLKKTSEALERKTEDLTRSLKRAESLRLAAEARGQVTIDPTLAALLADAAVKQHAAPETRSALLETLATLTAGRILDPKGQWTNSIAFSPDGERIVTAGQAGRVSVWSVETGKRLAKFTPRAWGGPGVANGDGKVSPPAKRRQTHAEFVDSGRALFIWSKGCDVEIIDAAKWKRRARYSPPVPLKRASCTQRGDRVLVETDAGQLLVWRPGESEATPLDLKGPFRHTHIDPAGRFVLASGMKEKGARILDLETKAEHVRMKWPGRAPFRVFWSPDGREVIAAHSRGAVEAWDPETGRLLRNYEGPRSLVDAVGFSPDGQFLCAASLNDNWVWSRATGERLFRTATRSPWRCAPAVSPDGQRVLTASDEHPTRVTLWNRASGARIESFEGHASSPSLAVFHPDGERMATASERVILWNAGRRRAVPHLAAAGSKVVRAVWGPGPGEVTTGSDDGTVRIWSLESGAPVRLLGQHAQHRPCEVFVSEGCVISWGYGEVKVWDGKTGELLTTQEDAGQNVFRTPWFGRFVVSPTKGGITVWSTAERKARRIAGRLEGIDQKVGLGLVRAKGDRLEVWDLATAQRLSVLPGKESRRPRMTVFSADGKHLLRHCRRGRVRVWSCTSGKLLWKKSIAPRKNFWLEARSSPSGDRLLVIEKGGIVVRSWTEGAELARVAEGGGIHYFWFSGDGKRLSARTGLDVFTVFDAQTLEKVDAFEGRNEGVRWIRAIPETGLLYANYDTGIVTFWDAASGAERHSLSNLDGRRLVGPDPEGKAFMTIDRGAVRLWPLEPEAAAARFLPRELSRSERERFGVE